MVIDWKYSQYPYCIFFVRTAVDNLADVQFHENYGVLKISRHPQCEKMDHMTSFYFQSIGLLYTFTLKKKSGQSESSARRKNWREWFWCSCKCVFGSCEYWICEQNLPRNWAILLKTHIAPNISLSDWFQSIIMIKLGCFMVSEQYYTTRTNMSWVCIVKSVIRAQPIRQCATP